MATLEFRNDTAGSGETVSRTVAVAAVSNPVESVSIAIDMTPYDANYSTASVVAPNGQAYQLWADRSLPSGGSRQTQTDTVNYPPSDNVNGDWVVTVSDTDGESVDVHSVVVTITTSATPADAKYAFAIQASDASNPSQPLTTLTAGDITMRLTRVALGVQNPIVSVDIQPIGDQGLFRILPMASHVDTPGVNVWQPSAAGAIFASKSQTIGGSSHTPADVASEILATPENKLATNATGEVEASNMRGTDGAAKPGNAMGLTAVARDSVIIPLTGEIDDVSISVEMIRNVLAGITSLGSWLRGLFRPDAMDAIAKNEINVGDGTFDESQHSLPAIRSRGDAEWKTGQGGGGSGVPGSIQVPVIVREPDETRVPGVKVQAFTDEGNPIAGAAGRTDDNGEITLPLLPDNYQLAVGLTPGYQLAGSVDVAVSAEMDDVEIVLTPATIPPADSAKLCNVQVSVIDQHGEPIPGAEITASLEARSNVAEQRLPINRDETFTANADGEAIVPVIRGTEFVRGDGRYRFRITYQNREEEYLYVAPNQASDSLPVSFSR